VNPLLHVVNMTTSDAHRARYINSSALVGMRGSKRQVTGVLSAKDREMFGKAGYRILAVFILCQIE
jgi:hypothetical protein